jgi:hypothetical protein
MNKNLTHHRKKALASVAALVVCAAVALTGCAELSLRFSSVKGELIGNSFDAAAFDNFGGEVATFHAKKMGVEAASVDEDGNATSSVLKITADGRDIEQVGNTMVFAETGLEEVEGYTLPRDIQTTGGTVNLVDRAINDVKSKIGKSRVVVVSSQLGVPIAVYQGNSVGYEIPEDLPKFTKLTIDGKALYIHRANYLIIDKDAL